MSALISLSENSVCLYYANWCGHCQVFKPKFKKMKFESYKKYALNIDYDRGNLKITGGKPITSVPTVIIIKNGKSMVYEGDLKDLEKYVNS